MPAPGLDALRNRLAERMARPLPADTFNGPRHMAEAVARVESLLAGTTVEAPDPDALRRAMRRLAAGDPLTDRELVVACVGATTPVDVEDRPFRIVDDASLLTRLLDLAWQRQPAQRTLRKAAHGVAHAFFVPEERPKGHAEANWQHLGLFAVAFVNRMHRLQTRPGPTLPHLVEVLKGSTRPLWPYVTDGDEEAVAPVRHLDVAATSWVWRDMVRDAVSDSANWPDERFRSRVDRMLEMVCRHETITDEGIGLLLQRYAAMERTPVHEALRDTAVDRWRSPLIAANRPRWERLAGHSGLRLVAGWLGRNVISTFFETVSTEYSDPRRTAFWERYAEHIDEFWVYLSYTARQLRSPAVDDLRRTLGAAAVRGVDHDHTSAFVMMIGDHAYVEFSDVGNALYVYDRDDLPFKQRGVSLRIPQFKERERTAGYLTHQGAWEQRARDLIGDLGGPWIRRA